MRRLELDEIKGRRFYYRNLYRLMLKVNYYSMCLVIILGSIIAFKYFFMPEPDYYSTNSESSIKPLRGMMEPNYTSEALLQPDMPEETSRKRLTI